MINQLPTVISCDEVDGGVVLALAIDMDIPCVQGHFPDISVVPGVAQVDWVMQLARRQLALQGRFAGMDAIKFQQLLRPGMHCQLTLEWLEAKRQLRFRYVDGDAVFSSGRIHLAAS
ncbi:3-hydroxymyristoyl/3-hydroxydecanoyl-(acyl carrier protein) dehydratase [Sinobacterium caligoides]|uniref:3-hydroxymyristoyl/3-hydroxydecanoyl-(Acyl carrier protein) dehydratase n=1 Tax=Sinobacterium caligoides TaxID=933926 RepID=A0A3N2DP90_9GAMM|nr:hydroxymyristoyl-ACP dehydratase [Sinobacterium caligoides]ROS01586.1 3-hydroxymyristoyl/3-hydroxydecanoyl-(acyl carrier protein) dehydratase [Sinobacterium caligoides]